jgi:hypothetical protein
MVQAKLSTRRSRNARLSARQDRPRHSGRTNRPQTGVMACGRRQAPAGGARGVATERRWPKAAKPVDACRSGTIYRARSCGLRRSAGLIYQTPTVPGAVVAVFATTFARETCQRKRADAPQIDPQSAPFGANVAAGMSHPGRPTFRRATRRPTAARAAETPLAALSEVRFPAATADRLQNGPF